MDDLIRLQLTGTLIADATTHQVNGKTVIRFTVCNKHKYSDREGEKQRITIVHCIRSKKSLPSLAGILRKGVRVYVEGVPEIGDGLRLNVSLVRAS